MTDEGKGVLLAFTTAIISGAAVFVNSFGVQGFDPFTYATLKNVFVAAALVAAILFFRQWSEIKALTRRQWLQLAAIGVVGGSIPFLLFFWGLKLSIASSASFVHKTMFVFAAILAVLFLRERVTRKTVLGAAGILAGTYLFVGQTLSLGFGELLVLAATLFWAVEQVVSKKALEGISPRLVACGRMLFGSIILVAFLAFTGRLEGVALLDSTHWQWVLVSSAFLLAYVSTWYAGLKHVGVAKATAVLTLGAPVTAMLSSAFAGNALTAGQAFGMLLLVAGVWLVVGTSALAQTLDYVKRKWTASN